MVLFSFSNNKDADTPPKKPDKTTSKRILRGSWAAAISLTLVTLFGYFFTEKDITPLVTLAGFAWGELTAAHGFYYWKAKNENRRKLAISLIKDFAEKHGIEAVARIAEVVLKD